jgi:hypothetical protein
MGLLFGLAPDAPTIITYPQASIFEPKDAPNEFRWRAQWHEYSLDDSPMCIALQAYPVDSVTRCGAWVRPDAFWSGGGWEPKRDWERCRWVSNTGGAAWAKPTREEALHSLAVRLTRWTGRVARDVRRVKAATEALRMLRPQDVIFADRAAENLRSVGVA